MPTLYRCEKPIPPPPPHKPKPPPPPKKPSPPKKKKLNLFGGEGGIRTHGAVKHHWFSRPAP